MELLGYAEAIGFAGIRFYENKKREFDKFYYWSFFTDY
jgi:hypothetical protein